MTSEDRSRPWATIEKSLSIALLLGLLVFLFAHALHKRLDHDEHQFVASGALLARFDLLPYRDYPYFHTPNLVFVYALLFKFSDHLLLVSRIFCASCGFLAIVLVFIAARRIFNCYGRRAAFTVAAFAAVTTAATPLFLRTTGRAWNHDPPMLLALAAFLCAVRALRSSSPRRVGWWMFFIGLLIGLAIGTRLTFAPVWAAFLVMIAIAPAAASGTPWRWTHAFRRKFCWGISFLAGNLVALVPSLVLFAMAPRQFIFGNIRYPLLNTAWRFATGYEKSMSAMGKFKYFFTDALPMGGPGTPALLIAFVVSIIAFRTSRGQQRHPHFFEMASSAAMIACLLVGAYAPTPLFTMYFFTLVPFVVLFVLYVAADARKTLAQQLPWLWFLFAVAAVTIGAATSELRVITDLANIGKSTPMRAHSIGREIFQYVGTGRVLTFAPIFPLEGGSDIFAEYATGPFANRAAQSMSKTDEAYFHVYDQDDWLAMVRAQHVAAVFGGLESTLDDSLKNFGREQRLRREVRFTFQGRKLFLLLPAVPASGTGNQNSATVRRGSPQADAHR